MIVEGDFGREGNEKLTQEKKPDKKLGRLVAIIAATAGLISASMPGIVSMVEGMKRKEIDALLKSRVEQSKKLAELSEKKTELSYELLRQKIDFMAASSEKDREELRDIRNLVIQILQSRTSVSGATRVPARSTGDGRGGGVLDGFAARDKERARQASVEKDLPADLDAAMAMAR